MLLLPKKKFQHAETVTQSGQRPGRRKIYRINLEVSEDRGGISGDVNIGWGWGNS